MAAGDRAADEDSGSPRPHPRSPFPLLLAVAASAVPLLVLGRVERIGYDAFWHVFIAGREDWSVLLDEVLRNAHPPLFYLALKAAIGTLGADPLVYRLVPGAAMLGSTWLVGRIVERITGRRWLPAVAALAFGTSLSAVVVGLDVRAYPLAVLFALWACLALLELVDGGFAAPDRRARTVFALATSLALLTHYLAALFLLGAMVAAAAPAALDRHYRRRLLDGGRRRRAANLLTFGVPCAVLAAEYAIHIRHWSDRLAHVPEFLFDPAREGAAAFVWRNTRALLDLFVPAIEHRPWASTLIAPEPRLSPAAVAVLAAVALAAVAWLALRPAASERGRQPLRRVPPLLLLTVTALVIALALLGRYPYGGYLRHQFVLLPFAVVVLALVVDEAARGVRRRLGRPAGAAVVALFAIAALLNTWNWASHFRITREPLMQAQVDRFRAAVPAPEAVYVDHFNLVNLFMHHAGRRWRLEQRLPGGAPLDVWRVGDGGEGGGEGFAVCRDQHQWQLDLSQRSTYRRLRRCLKLTGAQRVAVFRPQQPGADPAWPLERTGELAARLAESTGMAVETLEVGDGGDVYATFRLAGDAPAAAGPAAMLAPATELRAPP